MVSEKKPVLVSRQGFSSRIRKALCALCVDDHVWLVCLEKASSLSYLCSISYVYRLRWSSLPGLLIAAKILTYPSSHRLLFSCPGLLLLASMPAQIDHVQYTLSTFLRIAASLSYFFSLRDDGKNPLMMWGSVMSFFQPRRAWRPLMSYTLEQGHPISAIRFLGSGWSLGFHVFMAWLRHDGRSPVGSGTRFRQVFYTFALFVAVAAVIV